MAGEHTAEMAAGAEGHDHALDFIFAKGKLALDYNGTMPLFEEDHAIRIRKGRHPLLDKKKVVPLTSTWERILIC